jgi:hypothetical protein
MKKHAGALSASSQSLAEKTDILLPLSVVGRHHRSGGACILFRLVCGGAFFLLMGAWWPTSLSAGVSALPERGATLGSFSPQAQIELPGSTVWLEHTHDAHIDFLDYPAPLGLAHEYNLIAEVFRYGATRCSPQAIAAIFMAQVTGFTEYLNGSSQLKMAVVFKMDSLLVLQQQAAPWRGWRSFPVIPFVLRSFPIKNAHDKNPAQRQQWIKAGGAVLKAKEPGDCRSSLDQRVVDFEGYRMISYTLRSEEGCITFPNGDWLYLLAHSTHRSEAIGDITLAIDHHGRLYRNEGHICGGVITFFTDEQASIGSVADFVRYCKSDTDDQSWIIFE